MLDWLFALHSMKQAFTTKNPNSMLRKKSFSRLHFEMFFLFFPENRLCYFMQIVSEETICMK